METKEYRNDYADRYEARGEAKALMTVLKSRNIELSEKQRELVVSCLDADQVDTWVLRAATAETADEVFKD